jgi:hypothetical protein
VVEPSPSAYPEAYISAKSGSVFFSLLFVYWFPRSEFVTTRCAPLEL